MPTAPGMAFGNSLIKFLGSNLFARLAGYPAIVLGFFSDSAKAHRQFTHGDRVTAAYTASGGLSVALGSAVVLEAGLAIAGVTTVVPFAGWAAAALVLAGAAIITGGIALQSEASDRLYRPIELWAARCIFGNRLNDGEIRAGIDLDLEGKLPTFTSAHTEIEAWNKEHYGPKLISTEQALSLGAENTDTKNSQSNNWSLPDWVSTIQNSIAGPQAATEFTVLLPAFLIGTSTWSGRLSSTHEDGELEISMITSSSYITEAGLVLHIKPALTDHIRISLHLSYNINHGPAENTEITSIFHIEH